MWLTNKETGGKFNTDWQNNSTNKLPIDVTDKNIRPMMPNTFKEQSQKYYDSAVEALSSKNDLPDVNDVESVVRVANDMASKHAGHNACYRVAAYIAAMFDKRGVPYKCYFGAAKSNPREDEVGQAATIPANHVWIEANGKVYEKFIREESKGTITHLNIAGELTFKRKE